MTNSKLVHTTAVAILGTAIMLGWTSSPSSAEASPGLTSHAVTALAGGEDVCASCKQKTIYNSEGGTASEHSFSTEEALNLELVAVRGQEEEWEESRLCTPGGTAGEDCHDWRRGGCDSHFSCSEQSEEAARMLLRAVAAGDHEEFWRISRSDPETIRYNQARGAIQVVGCAGVVAHIPVSTLAVAQGN